MSSRPADQDVVLVGGGIMSATLGVLLRSDYGTDVDFGVRSGVGPPITTTW